MANHKSAKKRARSNEKKAQINKSRTSRVRTFLKKVETAVSANDKKAADEALTSAQSEMDRGVAKGILKKKTASRKISRLSKRIKALKK
jgi:small subunit ribosomal protein S20